MSTLSNKLVELNKQKEYLVAEETILMRKAFQSNDPNDLVKASQWYAERQYKQNEVKSFFIDPTANHGAEGYLLTPQRITDYTLRRMANTPIIKAIIETRVEEVADFLEPQPDKYSPGFVIRRKGKYFKGDDEDKQTKEDKQKIELITDFLLKGCANEKLEGICDDFTTWGRKTVKDSLTLDKMASEIIWNNAKTVPMGFVAVDAATIFYADNYNQDGRFDFKSGKRTPYYVQTKDNVIVNEYLKEEMMWGVRNGQTTQYFNGYGESELEVLIATVTSMLQGDAYNANIFKVGSVPGGLFRVSGNINTERLKEFQMHWRNEMVGFSNHGKMGFIEADKMEYVDMSKSNRDMEYSKYQEYLIKLSCAVYKISPEEIGFQIEGAGKSSMFKDSGKERLKYSRDKGLKPLLKFLQTKINGSIIRKIDPDFEFVFVGIEMETEEKELEMAMKKASSFKSLKEVRRERGLPDEIDPDDIILNPVWMQWQQIKQAKEQSKMMGNPESDQFMENDNPFEKSWHTDEKNPMSIEFEKFVKEELVS